MSIVPRFATATTQFGGFGLKDGNSFPRTRGDRPTIIAIVVGAILVPPHTRGYALPQIKCY